MNTFWQPSEQGELYHYGVMGMKWGVRKANRYNAKAKHYMFKNYKPGLGGLKYTKDDPRYKANHDKSVEFERKSTEQAGVTMQRSKAHLQKIESRYQKAQSKADAKYRKAEAKANSLFASKRSGEKAFRKAAKAQYKANKIAYKGKKFYDQLLGTTYLRTYPTSYLRKKYGGKNRYEQFWDNEIKRLGNEFNRRVSEQSKIMYANSYK